LCRQSDQRRWAQPAIGRCRVQVEIDPEIASGIRHGTSGGRAMASLALGARS
jgi:hypothetical protein